MNVIGVVGLPASGKGEFSRIAAEMGIPVVVMGDVIREEIGALDLPPTDENLGAVSAALRRENGPAAIALRTIPRIESVTAPLVVIDGIRSDAEVEVFRQRFPGFILVAVVSRFDLRFRRLAARQRSDDPARESDLIARDDREIGWGLSRAMNMADIEIENAGTLEEFEASVRRVLSESGR